MRQHLYLVNSNDLPRLVEPVGLRAHDLDGRATGGTDNGLGGRGRVGRGTGHNLGASGHCKQKKAVN